MLLIVLTFTALVFADVVIGSGTSTQYYPMSTYYNYYRSATLYTAAEINANGTITHLKWYCSTANTSTSFPITIYLKHSSATVLTNDTWANYSAGATQVFTGTLAINATGWFSFDITDFAYNGTDNLMVLIESGSATFTSPYVQWRYTTTATNMFARVQADEAPPTNLTASKERPNITLVGITQAIPPVATTLVSPANNATGVLETATLNWNQVSGATGYKLYFGTDNPPTNLVNGTNLGNVITYDPPGNMLYNQQYYWKVVPTNTYGDATGSVVWSFTTRADPIIHLSGSTPHTQDFGSTGAAFPPANWTKHSGALANPTALGAAGTGSWNQGNWKNISVTPPNYAAKLNVYSTWNGWLISPAIDVPGNDYEVMFDVAYMKYGNNNTPDLTGTDDVFAVLLGDGTSWGTANIVRRWDNAGSPYVLNNIPPAGMTVNLPLGTAGVKRLAFYAGSTVSNADNDLMVDNIVLRQVPATPIFSITPVSKNFGEKKVFTNTDQVFTISNTGAGTLGITQLAIDGASCFSIVSPPSLPVYLTNMDPPLNVTVRYRPMAQGSYSADLVVSHSLSPDTPFRAGLQGTAIDAILPLPYTQNFNAATTLPQNWTQSTSTWTIGSTHGRTGNAIYKNMWSSATTAWFQTQPIGPIVANTRLSFYYRWMAYSSYPAGSYTPVAGDNIKVYLSTDEGATFNLYATIDASNHAVSTAWTEKAVWLSGSKATAGDRIVLKFEANWGAGDWYIDIDDIYVAQVDASPSFNITPLSHDFGSVRVGQTASKSFTISNGGINPLIIPENGISLGGDDPEAYSFTLPVGTVYPISITTVPLVVNVSFAPTAIKTYHAKLVVLDNLSKATNNVDLTGAGYDPTIRNFPYVQDFEGAAFPPLGWTVVNADGGGSTWQSSTSQNHTPGGSKSAQHSFNTSGDQDGWLITAPIALPASGKYQLSFWSYTSYPTYYVYRGLLINNVSTVPNAGWTELWSPESVSTPWAKTEVDLKAYAGQTVFLAFRYMGNDADTWNVDDIRIEEYFDVNDDDNEFVIDAPTNTTVSITGGNANVDTSIDETSLPPWNNSGFNLATAFKLELFGSGPWTLTIHTDAPWIAYYYNGAWHALDASSGTVTFIIDSAKGDVDIDVIAGDKDPTLPVTLSSFTATLNADMAVTIAWVAETETNHSGYNVLRSEENDLSNSLRINAGLITDGSALGTQISYNYTDLEANINMVYYYWLESVALDGTVQYAGPVMVTVGDPTQPVLPPAVEISTQLLNAYPNPFNPNTTIRYSLKKAGKVDINIYNLKGQLVHRYSAQHDSPGYYQMGWDGKDMQGKPVSSGIYLYRMTSGKYSANKKMILAK